jgi:hypothetical protein
MFRSDSSDARVASPSPSSLSPSRSPSLPLSLSPSPSHARSVEICAAQQLGRDVPRVERARAL